MYERSIIVLERYLERILEFNKDNNVKSNYEKYSELLEKVETFQIATINEGKIIEEFDLTVKDIELIQKQQAILIAENKKLDDARHNLFIDLGEDSKNIETKLLKIERVLDKNHQELKELRKEFIENLNDFGDRQKERNKCEKARRLTEASHIEYIKETVKEFSLIDIKDIKALKDFLDSEKETVKQEIFDIMLRNGKSEKVGFDENIIKRAIKVRMEIAEKEIESYVLVYDRTKKLLAEIENDNLKLDKYKKVLKDVSSKLDFLEAEKEYIASFLDYERMTTIGGAKAHQRLMEEACNNFELDLMQINSLYELILREISNKSTKKIYDELYNNTYLKNIEDRQKNFEQEASSLKTNLATVINSNYWRIDGITNIYNIFDEVVTTRYEKDLSEYKNEYIEYEEDDEEYDYYDEEDIEEDEYIFQNNSKIIQNEEMRKNQKEELELNQILQSVVNSNEEYEDEEDEEDDYDYQEEKAIKTEKKHSPKRYKSFYEDKESEKYEEEEDEDYDSYDYGYNLKDDEEDEEDEYDDDDEYITHDDFEMELDKILERTTAKIEFKKNKRKEIEEQEDEYEDIVFQEASVTKTKEGKRTMKQDKKLLNKLFGKN